MNNTNRISPEKINEVKSISIVSFLSNLKIEPVKSNKSELVYLSPLRAENTPSFHVNVRNNVFIDFGGDNDDKGDIIKLVCLMYKCRFIEAINILLGHSHLKAVSFSFSGPNTSITTRQSIHIENVCRLKNGALIRYITNRGILLDHAFKYLDEIHYSIDGKRYFATGSKNDNGGYNLRNQYFKGKTQNGITFFDKGTETINLFEGYFDFLSALRFYNQPEPSLSTLILHTANNLKIATPILKNAKLINTYLDNDRTGEKAINELHVNGYTVNDKSKSIYHGYKDFNEYLILSVNNSLK